MLPAPMSAPTQRSRPVRVRLSPGEEVGDRYRVEGVLAVGGMSVVYAAFDPVLQRDVAVKVADTADGLDRTGRPIETEARLGAAVSHPGLTTVLDAGLHTVQGEQVFYLVMERARRGDLRSLLDARRLTWSETAVLGADLAAALGHLHAAGFLHRDVKPANVLVTAIEDDGRPRVRLTDFGTSSDPGEQGPVDVGTVAYLSPEQVQGMRASDRSDVYALGLVLVECMTGRIEFPGAAEASAIARLTRDPVVPDSLPPRLRAALRSMTARDPAMRPSAHAAAAQLRAVAGDGSVPEPLVVTDVPGIAPSPAALEAACRLAARLLGAPRAAVALLDPGGTRLEGAVGWDEPPRMLPDEGDLARFDTVAVVDDLAAARQGAVESRLAAAGVRGFAAVPLRTGDGSRLGVLCVFDDRPRRFPAGTVEDLRTVAATIVRDAELRVAARRAALGC